MARTTVIDRNAKIVTYAELEPAIKQLDYGPEYADTMFLVAEAEDVILPLTDIERLTDSPWHGSLPIGLFGGYLVWLRDSETAIMAWQSFPTYWDGAMDRWANY